jgi:hypothetical protein
LAEAKTKENANLAAEYFVASQLFRLGYIVNVTYGNTKQIDLVVIHPDLKRKVTIDVKGLKNKTNWPMPKNPLVHKDHFYVLISFLKQYKNLETMPEAFVIPSSSVRRIWGLWSGHKTQRGISYKKANTRKYKGRWDLLFRDKTE